MKHTLLLISLFIMIIACDANQSKSKTNSNSKSKTIIEVEPVKDDLETNFGLANTVIRKVNDELGLGKLSRFKNDAGPGEPSTWFASLEYDIKPKRGSSINSNNVIELSIGSEGNAGTFIEYLDITVGFMDPADEKNAKKLFIQKVNQLSKVLSIEIPHEIMNAIGAEEDLILSSEKFQFEVENFGATRKWMTLHIK